MARLKEVAQLAGVSPSVASRVLNNDAGARIHPDTRQRVLDAAKQLEYVPDHRARALRLSRAGAIALVVPEVNNAIFASLHAGVQEASLEHSSAVFLAQLVHDGPSLNRLIGNGRVDGVILQRSEGVDDDELRGSLSVDVPAVLFNTTLEGHTGSVSLDDRAAVVTAVEHLVALGHERIAFISGAEQHDAAARRRAAFDEVATARGLSRPEWVQPAGWEAPAGAAAMTALLTGAERPTAVVVASTNAAVGALSAALAAGVDVPGELSIVTVHETWLAQFVSPALTTVAMPMHAAGLAAATMLFEHLGGAELHDLVVTDPAPELVARGSTAAPRRT